MLRCCGSRLRLKRRHIASPASPRHPPTSSDPGRRVLRAVCRCDRGSPPSRRRDLEAVRHDQPAGCPGQRRPLVVAQPVCSAAIRNASAATIRMRADCRGVRMVAGLIDAGKPVLSFVEGGQVVA
jgi:hypothetical protein